MNLKQKLIECIPPAYYEDGTEAKCWIFKICNMFDVDSQSFKEVKKEKCMEKLGFKIDGGDTINITNLILDGNKIGIEDGKVVIKK